MSRSPKPTLSEAYLRHQARLHLDRYWPSAMQLRRVLMRRVDKIVRTQGGSSQEGAELVDRIVADLRDRGILDDEQYARSWIEQLQRQGYSRMAMRSKLYQRGISSDTVDRCLAQLDDQDGNLRLVAACRYARRRRLGPARRNSVQRSERRSRDLAAMQRAGFGFDLALQVIDCDDLDELERCAGGDGDL